MGKSIDLNAKPYIRVEPKIVFTTSAPGLVRPLPRQRMTPAESRQQEETMSVVKSQPHRQGSDDPRLAFPLGRLCARLWARDAVMGDKAWRAGQHYADDVRQARVLRNFHVVGSVSEQRFGAGGADDPTCKEIEARQALIVAAERTIARANEELLGVVAWAPRAVHSLVVDMLDPSPNREYVLKNALWRLAVHYGYEKLGINYGKQIA